MKLSSGACGPNWVASAPVEIRELDPEVTAKPVADELDFSLIVDAGVDSGAPRPGVMQLTLAILEDGVRSYLSLSPKGVRRGGKMGARQAAALALLVHDGL